MSVSPADQRTAPTTSPDWSAIGYDVFCPLCEYNLRGLIEPRCPECGYRFDWPEILNPDRRLHPYLFEHHPERNWWSFWKTARGACRPKKFWTSLHPAQPSRPRRMVLYWLMGLCLLIVLALIFILPYATREIQDARSARTKEKLRMTSFDRQKIAQVYGSVENHLDQKYPTSTLVGFLKFSWATGDITRIFRSVLLPLALIIPLTWVLGTIGGLMAFQISMRRGRLRPAHLVRCVLYSYDFTSWALLYLIVCAFITFQFQNASGYPLWEYAFTVAMAAIGPAIVMSAWRLRQACMYYLRFDHPSGTVVAIQVIALLATLAVLGIYDHVYIYGLLRLVRILP